MAVEAINLLSPGVIILGAVLVLLVGVVLFLSLTQRHLKKKLVVRQTQMQRFQKFYGELESMRNTSEPPEVTFKKLDEYVKSTLKERFQLGERIDYSAMMHLFHTLDKKHIAQFCNQMLQVMYSGDKVDKRRLDVLINNFETIVREERIRPIQRVMGEKVQSTLIKPKPLQQQTLAAKSPLPADIFKKSIENAPVITAPIKTLVPKPITTIAKTPMQLARPLSAQMTPIKSSPIKKRSWWKILLGIRDIEPNMLRMTPPKITGEPKILTNSQEIILKDEAIKQQKIKNTLARQTAPKKHGRTFLQWLLGIHPEQLQSGMGVPRVNSLKIEERPPLPPTINFTEKKKGFFASLFEKKETQQKAGDALPDLTVPELPELFPVQKESAPQRETLPPPAQAPIRPDGSWSYANAYGKRRELTIPTQSRSGIQKLPNDSFEIYTVKEAIMRPESEPQFLTPKEVKSTPSVPQIRENQHIEGIDNFDRIKSKIDIIHKLRREAKLEK